MLNILVWRNLLYWD